MFTRRSFLSAAGALAVAATLAACGSDNAGDGGALSKDTKAELTLAYWDKNQTPTVQAGVKAFNEKYPNIKVTLSLTAFKDYFTKLRTQAEGDKLPDVFWMNGPNAKLYATNNKLAALDDLKDVDWSKYPSALADIYSVKSKHYGIPKDYDTIAVWVNKKLFAAAGVELPKADWTWEDFRKAAKAISDSGKAYGVVGDVIGGGQETYYNTIAQAGGYVIKDGKSGYGQPEAIKGLEIWAELIKDGSMPKIQVMTDTKPDDLFKNDKAAMYWAGSWQANVFKTEYKDTANLQVVPLPKDKQQGSVIHGLAYVASAGSKHLAAAKALVAVMASKEVQEIEATNGTAIPAYEGAAEKWTKLVDGWDLKVYTDAAEKYAVAYPVSINTAAWNKKEVEILVPAFEGKTPVAQAAKQLASEMDALLAKEKQ